MTDNSDQRLRPEIDAARGKFIIIREATTADIDDV